MTDSNIELHPNSIVRFIGKSPEEFTKSDIMKFFIKNNFKMINFRYVAGDGRLKTLNFVISSVTQLDQILSHGERVDGSSLFRYISSAESDLYVIPRFRTAYVNPFTDLPTIDILCSYYTSDGQRLPSAPENIVQKAHQIFKKRTGFEFAAMAELEYYVIYDRDFLYRPKTQQGYHESAPFSKWEALRSEAMYLIAQAGGKIKYGHSEVGNIQGQEFDMEQHEIEFLTVPIEEAADQIVIAKWMLRMLGFKYGVAISFAPKVLVGHAGSGLHIHTKLLKDGKNIMIDDGRLSDTAKKTIAGFLRMAPSLTAFGNTAPISYLRLVPDQEAPTKVCWGDSNRSVLVRVPLGWLRGSDMVSDANPLETSDLSDIPQYQTIEFRCPDGSANLHLLLAGLAVAANYGLTMDNSLEFTDKLYVKGDIFSPEFHELNEELRQLPTSCWESSECLLRNRKIYEADGVFPPSIIDGIVSELQSFHDQNLSENLFGKVDDIKNLVDKYLYSF